jgi:hypothetical protein
VGGRGRGYERGRGCERWRVWERWRKRESERVGEQGRRRRCPCSEYACARVCQCLCTLYLYSCLCACVRVRATCTRTCVLVCVCVREAARGCGSLHLVSSHIGDTQVKSSQVKSPRQRPYRRHAQQVPCRRLHAEHPARRRRPFGRIVCRQCPPAPPPIHTLC